MCISFALQTSSVLGERTREWVRLSCRRAVLASASYFYMYAALNTELVTHHVASLVNHLHERLWSLLLKALCQNS